MNSLDPAINPPPGLREITMEDALRESLGIVHEVASNYKVDDETRLKAALELGRFAFNGVTSGHPAITDFTFPVVR